MNIERKAIVFSAAQWQDNRWNHRHNIRCHPVRGSRWRGWLVWLETVPSVEAAVPRALTSRTARSNHARLPRRLDTIYAWTVLFTSLTLFALYLLYLRGSDQNNSVTELAIVQKMHFCICIRTEILRSYSSRSFWVGQLTINCVQWNYNIWFNVGQQSSAIWWSAELRCQWNHGHVFTLPTAGCAHRDMPWYVSSNKSK